MICVGCYENKKTEEEITLNKIGELRFRRSYAANQFREVPQSEFDSIQNSNPSGLFPNDTTLLTALHKNGIVDSCFSLIRSKFDSGYLKEFVLMDGERKIICRLERQGGDERSQYLNFVASHGNKQDSIPIMESFPYTSEDIKLLLVDIKTGGFKEIVILYEYYIMNGDNSDLFIYEVKIP